MNLTNEQNIAIADPKRWVWTDKGAHQMNERSGSFVWDNYQDDLPPHWVKEGLVRPATEADGEPGQLDLLELM